MAQFDGVDLADLVINTQRLLLQPWSSTDAPRVREALDDPGMTRFLAVPHPYTDSDADGFLAYGARERARGSSLTNAVVERGTGRLVGSAILRLPFEERDTAHVGYWIAADAAGRGYATEVTCALAHWGFAHGLHRIELMSEVGNLASAAVALAAGFRFEAVRRAGIALAGGSSADLAVFARLTTDSGTRVPRTFAALPPQGLTDGVLTLRVPGPADLEAFVEQETDPVTLQTGFSGTASDRERIARMLARAGLDWLVGDSAPFSVVDDASGRFAGSLRLRLAGPPNVGGIGYAIHPGFRGRGYTARALRLLVPWAFETGGFARLELGAKTANVASQRAALAGGFQPDGTRATRLRNADGTFSDEVRFVLINPRYR